MGTSARHCYRVGSIYYINYNRRNFSISYTDNDNDTDNIRRCRSGLTKLLITSLMDIKFSSNSMSMTLHSKARKVGLSPELGWGVKIRATSILRRFAPNAQKIYRAAGYKACRQIVYWTYGKMFCNFWFLFHNKYFRLYRDSSVFTVMEHGLQEYESFFDSRQKKKHFCTHSF
jgi:hypothetical protein